MTPAATGEAPRGAGVAVIGNVHDVGTAELTSSLMTTPAGPVLLDAPQAEVVE